MTDQWLPSVVVASNGVVGVLFYDRRNDPANNLDIDAYLAMSTDGGQTLLPNQRITATSFPPAINFNPGVNPTYMDDYNQMVAVGTRFYVVRGDNRNFVNQRPDPNAYFAVVGIEDCYVRDNPADDGTVHSTAGRAWQSPNIHPETRPIIFDTPTPVHLQVHNRRVGDAADVMVCLYWTDPTTHAPAGGVAAGPHLRRDNSLAVRNAHVQAAGGEGPVRFPFFIVDDPEEFWLADLVIDPATSPRGSA